MLPSFRATGGEAEPSRSGPAASAALLSSSSAGDSMSGDTSGGASGGAADVNLPVFHTVLIKAVRDSDEYGREGAIVLDATCIQRVVVAESVKRRAHVPEEGIQFGYRVNEVVTKLDERKSRVVGATDNADLAEPVEGTCTTYATTLPLKMSTIFSMYPFNIRLASVKLELSSTSLRDPTTDKTITLRPDLVRDANLPHASMVTIQKPDALDNSTCYGLVSNTPVVYGDLERKAGSTEGEADVLYTPIVHVGFYIFEPATVSIIYMLAPVALVLAVLTTVLDEDTSTFRTHLATMSVALIVCLTQGNLRAHSVANNMFVSPADLFVLCIFLGMAISAAGSYQLWLRTLGVCVGWAAFLVPLTGMVLYNHNLGRIRAASEGLSFDRATNKGTVKGLVGKEKGEAFAFGSLQPIPADASAVPNSHSNIFPSMRKVLPSFSSLYVSGLPGGGEQAAGGGATAAAGAGAYAQLASC